MSKTVESLRSILSTGHNRTKFDRNENLSNSANTGSSRLSAFRNLSNSIQADSFLPDQVFFGRWSTFLFFESDQLFLPSFAQILVDFLRLEQADSCCLLNYSRTVMLEYQEAAMVFVDAATSSSDYMALLNLRGGSNSWLAGMDRYGCMSDGGEWCIYCERDNDVAIIGLLAQDGLEKFARPLKNLGADTLDNLSRTNMVPFGHLTSNWLDGLNKNYRQSWAKS